MQPCVIAAASRTAVGRYLGSLKTVEPELLAAAVIKESLNRARVNLEEVDLTVLGHVMVDGEARNIARVASLLAGAPEASPAYSVDLQCGSGLQAVRSALMEIQGGSAQIAVAGGVESMSRGIFYLPPSVRYEGFRAGDVTLHDSFFRGAERVQPPALYPGLNMGLTAENVAARHAISREAQDDFALHSQQKAQSAIESGAFADEIVPFTVKDKKTETVFSQDEHPRFETTKKSLAALKPAFKPDGTVTAGNSSGMNDGASAVVLMSGEYAAARNIAPLATIRGHSLVGLDPAVMGLGPVAAIRTLLRQAGLGLDDIDLYEINEAFAAQSLGVLRELGMAPGSRLYDRVNIHGGAIALGHALGNSGTRLLTTLCYALRRHKKRYGVAALCIGGGMGIAMLVEAA